GHAARRPTPMNVYPLVVHLPFCLGIPGKFCIEELTGYGLMMMVAFLKAGWVIQVDLRRRHMNEDYAADIVFGAVIGGIVGAKIWYVLLTGAWVALLGRGGFVWYGGFLGGAARGILNYWRMCLLSHWLLGALAAPVP